MSQRSVEGVIGKLATDEAFRRRFFAEPAAVLRELGERGAELTFVETQALLALDPDAVESWAGPQPPPREKV
jgi:hypothetical protein